MHKDRACRSFFEEGGWENERAVERAVVVGGRIGTQTILSAGHSLSPGSSLSALPQMGTDCLWIDLG